MGSNPGRQYNNWRGQITGLFRALVFAIGETGVTAEGPMYREFCRLAPTHQRYFKHPVTPHQVNERWDKAVRGGYETELRQSSVARFIAVARDIVRRNVPLTDADIERIVTAAEAVTL